MKRRTKGSGCIIKQANGYYYGRIVRNGKASVIRLSKNQREANALWAEWLEKHQTAPKTETAKHPIAEAWAALEGVYVAKGTAKRVVANYRHHYEQFAAWCEKQGKVNLEDITSADIANCIADETEGQSNCLKRNFKYMVGGLYSANMPDATNPAKAVKIAWQPQTPREPLTDAEIESLLQEASTRECGEEFQGLIKVALYTGLRRKDCVYLNARQVKDGVIMATPYKTKQKDIVVRIPIHEDLQAVLDAAKPDANGNYFPSLIEMYEAETIDHAINSIFEACFETSVSVEGRTRKVPLKTFHALRATFLTRLAQKNVSLAIMESIAGHLRARQTMHYVHPNDDVKKAAIDSLSFGAGADDDKVFMHPEVKKVIELCKGMIAETIDKVLDGKEASKKSSTEYGEIIGVGLVKDYLEARRKSETA